MIEGIGGWVTKRAFLAGDATALVEAGRNTTFNQLDERTDRLARALRGLGVRQGDRVAGLLVNSVAFVETMLAVAKLGAVFVPANTRLAPPEVSYLLADSGADVFVYSAPLAPVARGALPAEGVRVRHRLVAAVPGLGDAALADGELGYEEVLASGDPLALGTRVAGSDLANLMYTSGTTGKPKGAMLTHDNHLWNVINSLSFGRGLRSTDTTVTVAPMFHIGGLGVHTLPLLYIGGRNVVLPTFVPAVTVQAMADAQATVQFMVPAMWAAVMAVPDLHSYDLSNLELAISGGAPCPLPIIEYFQGQGISFQEGFGMTETAPGVSILDADHVKEKAGSIGRSMFHVDTRIVAEDGSGCRCRRGRGAGGAGAQHLRRLLGQAGGHGRGDPGRLVPHRRPRPHRRRGLRDAGGPQEGHDHHRRGERVPHRGRAGAHPSSGRARGRRRRGPGPAVG